jgi:flagellar biosynthesis/type III secretory pathway M-ring protein FliF/YscJ
MDSGGTGYKREEKAVSVQRPGLEMLMPNASPRQPASLLGAGAVVLLIVALFVRRRKRSRRAPGTEAISNAAEQARATGGHALGKAASAARDLVSEAADLVGDRHLDETLDRLQSALDEARSAAAAVARKTPLARR